MNLTTPTTIGELRRLVAAADDHAGAHMLWIDTSGEVHLTPLAVQAARTGAGIHTPAARLRFAAFAPGDGMVGPQAARNDRLIGELYFSILHHWLHAGDAPPGPLDVELDEFERHAPWASAASGAVWQRPTPHHAVGGVRS